MAQALSDMEIDEVSLVDDPANEQSRVQIVKAKAGDTSAPDDHVEPGGVDSVSHRVKKALAQIAPRLAQTLTGGHSVDSEADDAAAAAMQEFNMDMESISKSLEDAEVKLNALEAQVGTAETALTEAQEVIKAKDAEIAALKGDAPVAEDEIMKSLPESVRKRLEESDAVAKSAMAEIAKMREEAEVKEAIAKAADLKVGDAEVVGPLLMRVRKGTTTPADAVALETLLKSAGEVSATAALFKSVGSDAGSDGDPEEVLKAKAEEIQKANSGMTYQSAYAKAVDENPKLYNAYITKRRAA
ncbi:hypothetical protein UFOVP36_62 [uncultured Caudovirales phage]|uniref:Uncharacterized protein n=1 Tax=uncultured Caudovirales phage TaxID=2100421 RepID=A0A6J5KK43_9CAUD|nr:hypothetical protein UFOVP36_62 [uncultured Caudovirales phage]